LPKIVFFVCTDGNDFTYDGGQIHTLVCMQENFCNNMMESVGLSLFGQRIRY